MADAQFNCVAIFDAVPTGELNTAQRLRDSLRDISAYQVAELNVKYFKIDSRDGLSSAIADLLFAASSEGLKPWLHIEGHGADDELGFILGSGVCCSWEDLRDMITPLNVATGLNLVLVMATCFGGTFARSIRVTDRAPILALVGPVRELSAGEIEVDFSAFYAGLFRNGSFKEAIDSMNRRAGPGLYYRVDAKKFFYQAWAQYREQHATEEKLRDKAKRLYRRAKAESIGNLRSIGHIMRMLKREEPNHFNKFRDLYFMYDVDAQNKIRFPVTYKDAESRVSR